MAHFAKIDANGIVLDVIVLNNVVIQDENGVERESIGIKFCQDHYGLDTSWVQTSYTCSFRKNYAGPGFKYDAVLDAFIPPQPYPSWTLNISTCQWESPVAYPNDGSAYWWDESTLSWIAR